MSGRRSRLCALWRASSLLALASLAWASPGEDLARHLALAEQAASAEREVDIETAWRTCQEAVAVLPEGPRSRRCLDRIAFLDRRRDKDGTWSSWEALQSLRGFPGQRTAEEIRAGVVALLAREGVAPQVSADAALWLALDSLDRRQDAAEALRLTAVPYANRGELDEHLRERLILTHARALATQHRYEEAALVEDEIRVAATAVRRTPAEQLQRNHQEAVLTRAAWGAVALFALVSAPLVVRRRPRWPVPAGLVPLWIAVAGGWLVASRWADGAADAFPWMALGLTLVHLGSLAARTAEAPSWWRTLVGVLAALATLAVGWLSLQATDTVGWVWR